MNVGDIEYTVSVETQQSIDAAQKFARDMDKVEGASRKADASLGKFNGRTKKMADSVRRANGELNNQSKALSGLIKMAGAYLSIRAVRSAIDLADRYEEMAGRIRDATESTEEYNRVQERLLAVANRSYRALGEIQEAYIQSSRGLRDMGYSTEEALDITESLSLAFVRNSTSSDKAASAMNALVRATNRGTVLTDHWASLLIAVPTIVDDIAAATGKTSQEISKLGYAGQLSAGMLTEGLRVAREENGKVADEMATTVNDAVTRLTNSFQVLTAQVNESSGASGGLSSAIDELASILQDPKTVEAAVQLATGIATAFGGIIKGAKEVVNITRWMAEEVAAALHGPALDDVVRMTDEIKSLEKQAKDTREEMDKMRLLRINPFKSDAEYQAHYDELLRKIEFYKKAVEDAQNVSLPPPAGDDSGQPNKPQVKPGLIKPEDEEEAKRAAEEAKRAAEEAKRAAEALKRANDRNAATLENLREALYQTTLTGSELVERQAELSLNEYATPEQIADVKALAVQLKDAQDQAAELERRKGAFGDDVELAITGNVSPLSGGMFDDQAARYQAEADAEEKRYKDALARLKEAKELELEVKGGYMALEEQMAQEHIARMSQIETAKMQVMMQSVEQGFGAVADIMKTAFGEQSGLYKAAFVTQKAAAIAQSIVAIQQGIAMASANPWPANIGAMASVAAATAGIVSTIASIQIGSRRQGGPVSPGSMYRVNEGGKPEVFQNNLGQQYMIPNERGKVISNRDAQGGGGGIVINTTVTVDGGASSEEARQTGEQAAGAVQAILFSTIEKEMRPGGMLWSAYGGGR